MEFWAEAFHNLDHGRSETDVNNDLAVGDTRFAEIVMGDIDVNPASENVYIQEYYNSCDETRSTLGGPREQNAPTGSIAASEYMSRK